MHNAQEVKRQENKTELNQTALTTQNINAIGEPLASLSVKSWMWYILTFMLYIIHSYTRKDQLETKTCVCENIILTLFQFILV